MLARGVGCPLASFLLTFFSLGYWGEVVWWGMPGCFTCVMGVGRVFKSNMAELPDNKMNDKMNDKMIKIEI